jgi:hypothetical protein
MKLVQYHLYIISVLDTLACIKCFLFLFIIKKLFEIETVKKKEDIYPGYLQCIDSVQIMDIYFIY